MLSDEEREDRSDFFRAAGVGQIEVWTDEPYVDAIVKFFRVRERHGGRSA